MELKLRFARGCGAVFYAQRLLRRALVSPAPLPAVKTDWLTLAQLLYGFSICQGKCYTQRFINYMRRMTIH